MKSILTQSRWSPYGVGVGIGMLSWVTFALMDKALGASTTLVRTVAAIESWPTIFLKSFRFSFFGRGLIFNLIDFVDKILCLLCVALPKKGSLKNLANGSL